MAKGIVVSLSFVFIDTRRDILFPSLSYATFHFMILPKLGHASELSLARSQHDSESGGDSVKVKKTSGCKYWRLSIFDKMSVPLTLSLSVITIIVMTIPQLAQEDPTWRNEEVLFRKLGNHPTCFLTSNCRCAILKFFVKERWEKNCNWEKQQNQRWCKEGQVWE